MTWSKKLRLLKQTLVQAKDFGEVWTYFFDHFGDHSAFTSMGHPYSDAKTEEALREILLQLLGRKVELKVMLKRLPEHKFVHGTLITPVGLGTFFSFDDIHLGLIGIHDNETGLTPMARLTPAALNSIYPEVSNN